MKLGLQCLWRGHPGPTTGPENEGNEKKNKNNTKHLASPKTRYFHFSVQPINYSFKNPSTQSSDQIIYKFTLGLLFLLSLFANCKNSEDTFALFAKRRFVSDKRKNFFLMTRAALYPFMRQRLTGWLSDWHTRQKH